MFKQKPQINISCPSAARMWIVSACAFFCILQSALTDNGHSLVIALSSVFTAVLIESLLTWKVHKFAKIKDGSAVVTALVLSLLLPNLIHPVYAVFGTAFAITVVKYSFGGLGSNWLNPALGGWLFIRFSWQTGFTNALEGSLAQVSEINIISDVSALDNSVTSFLNDTIFSITGVQLPSGYVDLLFFNGPGLIADRGLFALLLGTVFIMAFGINRRWVPAVFLFVYSFLIRLAGDASGALLNGDMLFGLFSGGTMATAFILASEPASGAKLKLGSLVSVILAAILSWFFRYRCMGFTGCFIALALVNCFTPIIRLLEEKIFLSRGEREDIPEILL